MAALTWREVSAPGFGGATSTFRTGAELQNNALSGLGEALKQFQTDRTANVDGQVLANALQVNDPAQYQQKLNDGSFLAGVDPSQVSAKALGALGSRARDLLAAAATKQSMDQSAYTYNRTVGENAIQDNARGASANLLNITDPNLRNLSPEQQRALTQGLVALQGAQLNNQGTAFRNQVQVREDADTQAGIAAGVNVMRNSASAGDALGGLEATQGLSPTAYARAAKYLGGTYGDIYAPTGSPAPAGGAPSKSAPGTRGGSPYDTTFNFTPTNQPVSSMPIRDVVDLQGALKDTQGGSPVGAFQITQDTLKDFAPRVLGKDWESQPLSADNQEKIAKAIFDERKGGDLTKAWASLPNSAPGAYKNYNWDEMRSILAQGEVGQNLPTDPASLRALSQASASEVSRRTAQNNATGVTADIQKNLTDTRDAPTVVQDLIKVGGFSDANANDLLRAVTRAQRENPGLSAADVGSAIARSAAPSSSFNPLSRDFKGTTNYGGGVGVNDEVLASNLNSLRTGKADYLSQDNQRTRQQGELVNNAQSAFDQAMQDLQALQARKRLQPGISIDKAQNKLDRATQQLQRALTNQQQDPSFRPVRQ